MLPSTDDTVQYSPAGVRGCLELQCTLVMSDAAADEAAREAAAGMASAAAAQMAAAMTHTDSLNPDGDLNDNLNPTDDDIDRQNLFWIGLAMGRESEFLLNDLGLVKPLFDAPTDIAAFALTVAHEDNLFTTDMPDKGMTSIIQKLDEIKSIPLERFRLAANE